MDPVTALVCDFGGVLTTPVAGMLESFLEASGASMPQLGLALGAVGERIGANPLFELETGRMSEARFLTELGQRLREQLGRPVELHELGESILSRLAPNERMIDYVREVRGRGLRTAICTNNVREWSDRWRSMLPVSELFDVVVDSAFVGFRKPEPRIYELTLERLGVAAHAAVLVDDIEDNCAGAVRMGMRAVVFQSTDQAIADLDAALGGVPL